MAAQAEADVVALELEKVRPYVELLYERDETFFSLLTKRTDALVVSSRNARLPLQITAGGKAGQYSPDGGNMGRGTATKYDVAQVTPFYFKMAVEINKQVEYSTGSKEKAVENAVRREVDNSMAQFRAFLDKLCQTSGNGVLATITNVVGNVLTVSVPNGAALAYEGQPVQIYDTTLATNRGSATVTAVDPVSAQTITLDAAPGGTIATDVVVIAGLSGSLTTQSSLFGIKYHQNNATTGTWLNLNRATYAPKLTTPRVNAANAALTPGMGRLAMNLVRKSLGVEAFKSGKAIAYTNPEQRHALENLGIQISNVQKATPEGQANNFDPLFNGTLTLGGVKVVESINADQTRIDFLDLSHWGRVESKPIGYYKVGTQTVFPVYQTSGTDAGAPIAAFSWYYDVGFQIWIDSPRSGAFIDSLARPTGY